LPDTENTKGEKNNCTYENKKFNGDNFLYSLNVKNRKHVGKFVIVIRERNCK